MYTVFTPGLLQKNVKKCNTPGIFRVFSRIFQNFGTKKIAKCIIPGAPADVTVRE